MTDLAERLEAADKPTRKLSDEVLKRLGWTVDQWLIWRDPSGTKYDNPGSTFYCNPLPHPTADLNAVIAECERRGYAWQINSHGGALVENGGSFTGSHPNFPALAASAALVRAIQA